MVVLSTDFNFEGRTRGKIGKGKIAGHPIKRAYNRSWRALLKTEMWFWPFLGFSSPFAEYRKKQEPSPLFSLTKSSRSIPNSMQHMQYNETKVSKSFSFKRKTLVAIRVRAAHLGIPMSTYLATLVHNDLIGGWMRRSSSSPARRCRPRLRAVSRLTCFLDVALPEEHLFLTIFGYFLSAYVRALAKY